MSVGLCLNLVIRHGMLQKYIRLKAPDMHMPASCPIKPCYLTTAQEHFIHIPHSSRPLLDDYHDASSPSLISTHSTAVRSELTNPSPKGSSSSPSPLSPPSSSSPTSRAYSDAQPRRAPPSPAP